MKKILFILLLIFSYSVLAQPTATQLKSDIEKKLQSVSEDKTFGAEQKDKIIAGLTQALDNLKRTAEISEKTAEYDKPPFAISDFSVFDKDLKRLKDAASSQNISRLSTDQLTINNSKSEEILKYFTEKLQTCDNAIKTIANRRIEVPKLQTDSQQRLAKAQENIKNSSPDNPFEHTLASSQKMLADAELKLFDKELKTFDIRENALNTARNNFSVLRENSAKIAQIYRETLAQRKKEEAENAAETARKTLEKVSVIHPVLARLASENTVLADLRTGPECYSKKTLDTTAKINNLKKLLEKTRDDFTNIKKKIEVVGLTNAIGLLLRKNRADLSETTYLRAIERRKGTISTTQLQIIELQEKLDELNNTEAYVNGIMENLQPTIEKEKMNETKTALSDIVQKRKLFTSALLKDCNDYFVQLIELDSVERELVKKIKEYSQFIDERVFWIRSGQPFFVSELTKSLKDLSAIFSPSNGKLLIKSLIRGLSLNPLFNTCAVLFFVFYLSKRNYLFSKLESYSESSKKASEARFRYTLSAVFYTLFMSLPLPAVLFFFSFVLVLSGDSAEFLRSFSSALKSAAYLSFYMCLAANVFLPDGLAESHFRIVSTEECRLFKRQFLKMTYTLIPFFIFYLTVSNQEKDIYLESAGRILFIAAALLLARLFYSLILKAFSIIQESTKIKEQSKNRFILLFFFSFFPVILVLLAVSGYFYTSIQLFQRYISTIILSTSVFLGYLFIKRALDIARYTVAIKRSEQKKSDDSEKKSSEGITVNTQDIKIHEISKKTRKFFLTISFIIIGSGLWIIWSDVLPALKIMNSFDLWTTTARVTEKIGNIDGSFNLQSYEQIVSITLFDLIIAVIIAVITIFSSRNIPVFVDFLILERMNIELGIRFATRKISEYTITIIGFIFAFERIGLGWEKVQWLVAAVSVGLGFGLQEIFANFISGLIILFERPMRVGDIVTVGDLSGTVTKIQIRATTITNWDRKEIIIPNKEFITGQLINWTLSDTVLRVIFNVGVAYGTDTDTVRELLLKVAHNHEYILDDPSPKAIFNGFGDSSLDFELRVYIPNLERYVDFVHEINTAIDREFKTAHIEIPFPQRDIHIRSTIGDATLSK